MSMGIEEITINGRSFTGTPFFVHLLPATAEEIPSNDFTLRLRQMTYLAAERVGPREYYPLEEIQSEAPGTDNAIQTNISVKPSKTMVGSNGENAVSLLYMDGDSNVLPNLALPGFVPTRRGQVEAWMQEFFPGFRMEIAPVLRANTVTLGLKISDADDFQRPSHVGFGLTQVLPIIIAALSAEKGDIILIENPEVHLHPAGQSKMGAFLAKIASTGVQIILETHSDHLLNGIRRAVRLGTLAPEQAAIHFFGPRDEETPQVISPQIDETGNIDVWPKNFFDQHEQDLSSLLGWGE